MAARTFTKPSTSLDQKLSNTIPISSMAPPKNDLEPTRSEEAAKKVTDSYSKDAKAPVGAKDGNSKPGITFAAQDRLPKLPIPDLESSMKKYASALLPCSGFLYG